MKHNKANKSNQFSDDAEAGDVDSIGCNWYYLKGSIILDWFTAKLIFSQSIILE